MKLGIISTGEEVLSGQIIDTNAAWISEFLGSRGMPVNWRYTVGDRLEDLIACFRERGGSADAVIVNGGLGPTSDDLCGEAMARAMGEPLVISPVWEASLRGRFAALGRSMEDANLKQALLPRSAELIDNPIGTACGFVVDFKGSLFYFTPGVPAEMKRMVEGPILAHLRERFRQTWVVKLKRLHCFGLAESRLGRMLEEIALPAGVSFGYRTHLPINEIKIMGLGEDEALLADRVEETAARVREKVGAFLAFEDDDRFASHVQRLMIAGGFTLALAESCTGGMLSSQLVDIPGSSAYLERAYVTYSNRAKSEMIGVPAELIERQGAVSTAVARAMARAAQRGASVSHALAITGVAGPDGGSEDKPVGSVGLALATQTEVFTQFLSLPRWGRSKIRQLSAAIALDMLRRHLAALPVFAEYDYSRVVERDRRPVRET